MNIDIVVLRLLHIVSGAFWVGTILFMVLILRPRLRSLSVSVDRRLTQSIDRAVNSATGIAAVITVVAGIGLVLRLRWGRLDTLFDSGWGLAILVGFVASMGAFVVGAMEARAISIGDRLTGNGFESVAASLQTIDARIAFLGRLHVLFILIAVGSMASARFV